MAAFRELGLAPWLVEQARQMGLSRPTPVQASCIPPILQGECGPLIPRRSASFPSFPSFTFFTLTLTPLPLRP